MSSTGDHKTPKSPEEAKRELKQCQQELDNLVKLEKTDWRAFNQQLLKLIEVAKAVPSIGNLTSLKPLFIVLRYLSVASDKSTRIQAFRLIRYLLTDSKAIDAFTECGLHFLTSRSLERDSKYVWERMQALKVIRTIMSTAPQSMPRTLVQSLVAVAEASKDDFKRVCLEAVRELVLINPAVVASCNGIRTIINAILDPAHQEIAGSLTLTILFLLDQSSTRQYVRPNVELQILFSVFTDTGSPNNKAKEAKRAAAHRALVTIMRSWTGILCLASDPGGLQSLVGVLSLPPEVKGGSWAKEAVFELLFEVLHVVRPEYLQTITSNNAWDEVGVNLLHNYIVIVLLALIHCGLIEVLTHLAMSSDTEYCSVAQTLLTRILHLSADLLPPSIIANLHALPDVITAASSFSTHRNDPSLRFRAVNMISDLQNLSVALALPEGNTTRERMESKIAPHPLGRHIEFRKEQGGDRRVSVLHGVSVEQVAFHGDPAASYEHYIHVVEAASNTSTPSGLVGQTARIIEELRYQMDASMDELELTALMKRTMVLQTKDFKEWKFDLCLELFEGPLATASGLAIALGTKFVKRLCSFLRPDKNLFATLPWTLENMKYVRLGCQLFRVMSNSKAGCEYEFFVQLVNFIFATVMKEVGVKRVEDIREVESMKHRPMSRDSIATTVCREYFTFLGILSSSEKGLYFFNKNQVYSSLYKIVEDPSKDYLTRFLIANLDYGNNKPARTLLETWAKAGSRNLRRFVISHLRLLLRRHIKDFWQWGIGLLVAQLQWSGNEQDGELTNDVALMALSVLEEACADPKSPCLPTLIKKRPNFKLVGERANNILNNFLALSIGVEYMNRSSRIEVELANWKTGGGTIRYVQALENALVAALNSVPGSSSGLTIAGDEKKGTSGDVVVHSLADDEVPSNVGYVGPFGGFGGFRHSHQKLRSPADDYYFDRIHNLPWNTELVLEKQTAGKKRAGRTVQILTESFVHTVPVAKEADAGGCETFVVAVVLNQTGVPEQYKVDADFNIRVRLTVGADQSSGQDIILTAADRQAALGQATSNKVTMERNGVQWHFRTTSSKQAKPKGLLSKFRKADSGDKDGGATPLYLEAVWFHVPTPNTAPPTVSLAPHMYGELAKTQEGCLLLRATKHVDEFVHTIKYMSKDSAADEKHQDVPSSLDIRAALWAIAHVGSSPIGYEYICEFDIVEYISDQAKHCPRLSMRGTCFYVLGTLSRTRAAREDLSELGWSFAAHPTIGIVIPQEVGCVLQVPDIKYAGSWARAPENRVGLSYVPVKREEEPAQAGVPNTTVGQIILGHISNLGNAVTQKGSLHALRNLKSAHPQYFTSAKFMYEVMKIMATYSFRLAARKLVMHDLFSKVQFTPSELKIFDHNPATTDMKAVNNP